MSLGIARCHLDKACGCVITENPPPLPRYALVNGLPAAILFDYGCPVMPFQISPDYFIEASSFVRFGGQPVVRFTDRTIDGCPATPDGAYFVFSE